MSAIVWLNLGLGAVFFGLLVGVSLWLVLKHPDRTPVYRTAAIRTQRLTPTSPAQRPAYSASSASSARRPAYSGDQRAA